MSATRYLTQFVCTCLRCGHETMAIEIGRCHHRGVRLMRQQAHIRSAPETTDHQHDDHDT